MRRAESRARLALAVGRVLNLLRTEAPLDTKVSLTKERSVMADDDRARKCKHGNCDCTVAGDDDYCSEYCRDAHKTGITDIACSCEHDACR